MGHLEEQLRQGLRRFTRLEDQVVPAKVLAVDLLKMTADVAPLAAPDVPMYAVRLAAADAPTNGVICVPQVGSTVLVASVGTTWQSAYVAMVSEVADVLLRGNAFGGVLMVVPVVAKLNMLEASINGLQTLMATHVHPVLTPAGIPFPAAPVTGPFPAPLPPLPLTQRLEVENLHVKHG